MMTLHSFVPDCALRRMKSDLRLPQSPFFRFFTLYATSDAKGRRILAEMRASNLRLADAHALKEKLRRVYAFCETRYEARSALEDWCLAARESKIPEMVQMASTVESHLEGILGYWDFGHANSGSAEGFNTKVRLLMKQSYGLRDFKYLKLKIMDLPSRKIKASI